MLRADDRDLRRAASRHLWNSFTELSGVGAEGYPIIERGEGCYVFDSQGRRYLDGLAALYCVNAGHGRAEIAAAASAQATRLGFFHTWSAAHPTAIELAAKIAELAPAGLERVFFTSGGAEANESALKLARAYHRMRGEERRTRFIAREGAYHGTTMGALALTGTPGIREDFAPLLPGVRHVPNTNSFRLEPGVDPLFCAEAIEAAVAEDPETVAAVILEPVQNAGGCLVPPPGYFQRVREICDRHGILLISDEVICAWGRLGTWFGCQHFDYVPDIVTTAKGLTSGYAPMGAMIASEAIAAEFGPGRVFRHGYTFAGHPVASAIALANIELMQDEDLCGRVRELSPRFRERLEGLRSLPIVGDVRGEGYFFAVELVREQAGAARFGPQAISRICATLPALLAERGVICRVDARLGDPVVQFCPPLVAGLAEFDLMAGALGDALAELAPTL